MKMIRQCLCLLLVAAVFVSFDLGIYSSLTRRCTHRFGQTTLAIEAEDYLPFAPNTGIVQIDDAPKLVGELPVLDGAAALLPVYSAVFHALYPQQAACFRDGAFTSDSKLQYHNTHGAYQAVVDGTVDVIFCAEPSQQQLDYAKEKGVELELVPIGREAFVFLVNADNPVDSLTQRQIRDIYAGRIRNWQAVGGPLRVINPLVRNTGSGSQTSMLRFMDGTAIQTPGYALSGGCIGFSFRYYVERIAKTAGVKMLAVDGIYPTEQSVQTDTYPLCSSFYAVYRKANPNANIPRLLDWILSPAGQSLIAQSGYVRIR